MRDHRKLQKTVSRLPIKAVAGTFSLAIALLLAGCGGDSSSSASGEEGSGGSETSLADECSVDNMPEADAGFSQLPPIPPGLISDAKTDGEVIVSSGISEPSSLEVIAQAFEEAYPGIEVSATSASSSERRTKFLADAEAEQVSVDVITDYDPQFFADAMSQGYMLDLDQVIGGFTTVWPEDWTIQTPDGVTGVFVTSPQGFAYNTDEVPEDQVPASWEDLTNPEFKGHIQAKDPNDSSLTAAFYDFLLTELGDDGFEALVANMNMTPLHTDAQIMVQELAAGGAWVMPQAQPNVIAALAADGAPIEGVLPTTSPGTQFALGVANDAPHEAAASLFAQWTYSTEGQWVIGCAVKGGNPAFPTLTGVENFVPYDLHVTDERLQEINDLMGL